MVTKHKILPVGDGESKRDDSMRTLSDLDRGESGAAEFDPRLFGAHTVPWEFRMRALRTDLPSMPTDRIRDTIPLSDEEGEALGPAADEDAPKGAEHLPGSLPPKEALAGSRTMVPLRTALWFGALLVAASITAGWWVSRGNPNSADQRSSAERAVLSTMRGRSENSLGKAEPAMRNPGFETAHSALPALAAGTVGPPDFGALSAVASVEAEVAAKTVPPVPEAATPHEPRPTEDVRVPWSQARKPQPVTTRARPMAQGPIAPLQLPGRSATESRPRAGATSGQSRTWANEGDAVSNAAPKRASEREATSGNRQKRESIFDRPD